VLYVYDLKAKEQLRRRLKIDKTLKRWKRADSKCLVLSVLVEYLSLSIPLELLYDNNFTSIINIHLYETFSTSNLF